jgi:hypothetical protein
LGRRKGLPISTRSITGVPSLIDLLFCDTGGEVTFTPNDELAPPGDDDAVANAALPLGPSFLYLGALLAPPMSFLSEKILERSRSKSAIVSEIKTKMKNTS